MKILRILGFAVLACTIALVLGVGILFALFDGDKVKQELVQRVHARTQRTLSIPGAVGLSVWPNIALTLGPASLSEPKSAQPFVSIDKARISVAVAALLSHTVAVNTLELVGLKATVIAHKDGRFNFSDLLADPASQADEEAQPAHINADAKQNSLRMDIDAITLRNAQLVWVDEQAGTRSSLSDLDVSTGRIQIDMPARTYSIKKLRMDAQGKSGADAFSLRVDAPELSLLDNSASSDALSAIATVRGQGRALQAKLTLSCIQGSVQALRVEKMQAEVDAKVNDMSLQTQISFPLLVRVPQKTIALERITGKLDIAHPSMPMQRVSLPVSGRARADGAQSTAKVELDTQVDGAAMHLNLDVLTFAPLALAFELKAGKINLDKYLVAPASSASAPAQPEAQTSSAQTDASKIDLSALQKINVRGHIQVDALQLFHIKLAHVLATLSVRDGQLQLAPFSADLYQGLMQGRGLAQSAGKSMALQQSLTDIRIGPLLKDIADKDMLEGRGNLTLDVSSRGATLGALKKALQGTLALRLRDGAIKGINLGKSFRELKAQWGAGVAASTQQANSAQQTDFSELMANFRIAQGVARNDDLAMKSPFLRLGGAGQFDIGNSQMDYLAKVSVVNTDAGQGGQDLAQLKGLSIPVRLSGPFSAPSYRIEWGNMLSDAAKAKVQVQLEEKKQELGKKAEDALKEKLQDLFKR